MAGASRSRRLWIPIIILWWVVCLVAAALIAVPVIYQSRYTDRIYEGVTVARIPVGGLTVDEAATVIREGLPTYHRGAPVTLRYEARSWTLSPFELGVPGDAHTLAAQAYAVGRHEGATGFSPVGIMVDLAQQWQTFRFGYEITPPIPQLDENVLALALKKIAREIDRPATEATLNTSGERVTGVPGTPGWVVDIEAARAAATPLLLSGKGGAVSLVTHERQPAIGSVEAVVVRANALLSQPVTLVVVLEDGLQRTPIDRATLRSWLKLTPTAVAGGKLELIVQVEEPKIQAHLADLAKRLEKPAVDASVDWDAAAKQLVVLTTSRDGQTLDVKASSAAISQTLLGLAQNGPASPAATIGEAVAITLPLKAVAPKIDSIRLADLGIKELVTQGTTYFAGSAPERVQNIVNAASKFRGVIVPPNGIFSFNQSVGDVSAENGFVDSLIIRGDRTEVGVGGGVCQVSTTAFRAAVQGGFPIVERHTHSYVVSWYGEPGLDATIYTPGVDFRFRNDTNAYLLIKPDVDAAKGRITFNFYGTRPDRTVELSKPEITNLKQPEPPIYQEDGSLPKGMIKQVDWAKTGQDVVVKRTIRTGDKVVEEKITSKYEPWRSIFLYGPGAKIPEGAVIVPPVPTKAPTPTAIPTPKR